MLFILNIPLLFSALTAHAESCDDWFKKLKISPVASDCEMKCAMGNVDMGSFDCPRLCEGFCKTKKKDCSLSVFWKKVLDAKTEPFGSLRDREKIEVEHALSKLPKTFRPSSLKAIVRSSKADFLAPSNPASSSDEFIILFPRAFAPGGSLERILAHEVVHHLTSSEWSSAFEAYKKDTQWPQNDSTKIRPGSFVEEDGKASPEEDFANNVEYFLFEPNKLKQTSPTAFASINKKLSTQLKIEKGCIDENKINQ